MKEALTQSPITFNKDGFTTTQLLKLYYLMLRPRMIEEKMLILLRQGKVSKWFAGIGQEAIAVGATAALHEDEMIFPMHRNLGVFTTRQVPLFQLFTQWQGKATGFTKGRDRSFHFGAPDYHIVGMISHLGPQLSLASGVALSHRLRKEAKVALAFTGEGGTSEGEFHEALNVAAVWKLPVIFLIENNGYGLSTPVSQQYECAQLADRAKGYGMESRVIDGNNVLEVYRNVLEVAEDLRQNPRPVLIECMTFRQRGHEEASGTKYVPKELMDHWIARDPVQNFEAFLQKEGLLTPEQIDSMRQSIKEEVNQALQEAYAQPPVEADLDQELQDVFAPAIVETVKAGEATTKKRLIDAVSDGLREAMERHPELVLMGQDIADYGGVFKITDGFMDAFGSERVRNTPLCESAIVGIGLGLSIKRMKAMVEMQFADFVTCGFNQIVNNLAKVHYRWGQNADVVIRMPTGGSVGAGPFHSQSNEAWFTHTPGLKVVYPSNPIDAKGLLLAAFADPNPILFFEHKALYRSISEDVPDGYYTTPIGKAVVNRPGKAMSIITYGLGVHWAIKAVEATGIDAEILDLRTLAPLDYQAIEQTIKKTNRALILHEDCLTGGIGADLSAYISEHCFEYLDAPVVRVASLDTPVPFAKALEEQFLPETRLQDRMAFLRDY